MGAYGFLRHHPVLCKPPGPFLRLRNTQQRRVFEISFFPCLSPEGFYIHAVIQDYTDGLFISIHNRRRFSTPDPKRLERTAGQLYALFPPVDLHEFNFLFYDRDRF